MDRDGGGSSATCAEGLRVPEWEVRDVLRGASRRVVLSVSLVCAAIGAGSPVGVPALAAAGAFRRFRPPRRPRRRRFPSGPVAAGAADPSPLVASCTWLLTATTDSNTSAFCAKGRPGSGIVNANSGASSTTVSRGTASPASPATPEPIGGANPSLVAASTALVFQSARRKRSAAVAYHFPASAFSPAVSKWRASSNATMASCVFS